MWVSRNTDEPMKRKNVLARRGGKWEWGCNKDTRNL